MVIVSTFACINVTYITKIWFYVLKQSCPAYPSPLGRAAKQACMAQGGGELAGLIPALIVNEGITSQPALVLFLIILMEKLSSPSVIPVMYKGFKAIVVQI